MSPIFMLIYICSGYGGMAILMFKGVFVYLKCIGVVHAIICCLLVGLCLMLFIMLQRIDPGRITKANVYLLVKKYPYDKLLFHPSTCSTCKLEKVARSKHCSHCNVCIERQDHHCIWINRCIGAKNYYIFLLFLITHIVLCTDTVIILTFIFIRIINLRNDKVVERKWGEVYSYLMKEHAELMFVFVLCLTVGVTLLFLFAQHMMQIVGNRTNNEVNKVSLLKYRLENELKNYKDNEGDNVKSIMMKLKALSKSFYHKGVRKNIMEVVCPK